MNLNLYKETFPHLRQIKFPCNVVLPSSSDNYQRFEKMWQRAKEAENLKIEFTYSVEVKVFQITKEDLTQRLKEDFFSIDSLKTHLFPHMVSLTIHNACTGEEWEPFFEKLAGFPRLKEVTMRIYHPDHLSEYQKNHEEWKQSLQDKLHYELITNPLESKSLITVWDGQDPFSQSPGVVQCLKSVIIGCEIVTLKDLNLDSWLQLKKHNLSINTDFLPKEWGPWAQSGGEIYNMKEAAQHFANKIGLLLDNTVEGTLYGTPLYQYIFKIPQEHSA